MRLAKWDDMILHAELRRELIVTLREKLHAFSRWQLVQDLCSRTNYEWPQER